MKNAIDIGSSPGDQSVWAGKPGAMGGFGANHHLRQALVFLDVPVLQQPEIYLGRVDALFDGGGELIAAQDLLARFMGEFHAWIVRARRPPIRA